MKPFLAGVSSPQSAPSDHTETRALLRGCCEVAKAAVGGEERHKPAAEWGMWDVQDKLLGNPTSTFSISPQPPPA